MTIVNQSAKRTVQGNGAQTVFDYNFLIPTASAAELYFTDEETGDSYLLSPASWSLSGANNPLGGTFTYPRDTSQAPIKSTQRLTLRRIVPNTQNVALNNQGSYAPKVVEGGLDWVVMQVQQLAAEQGNALRLWPANEAIAPLPFSSAADRANTLIGFDGDGDPMCVSGFVGQALVSPFGGTLIAAPSPSAARGLLEIAPSWGGTAGGTANEPTISLNPPITTYTAGQAFEFISTTVTNTGAVALSVNGLGAVAINKGDGTVPLAAGDIPASHVIVVQYDGTRFRLISPTPLPDASVTTAKIADSNVTTAKIADSNVNTAKIADGAVTLPKIANIAASRLLGRTDAGTGAPQEISIGGGLTLTGGVLTGAGQPAATGDRIWAAQEFNSAAWVLPAGGTYAYIVLGFETSARIWSGGTARFAGVAAGGTTVVSAATGVTWWGMYWRIA